MNRRRKIINVILGIQLDDSLHLLPQIEGIRPAILATDQLTMAISQCLYSKDDINFMSNTISSNYKVIGYEYISVEKLRALTFHNLCSEHTSTIQRYKPYTVEVDTIVNKQKM